MSNTRKEIIERLLNEQKKTKRQLAAYLNIKENSINRLLKNDKISMKKLESIANFLEVDITKILPSQESVEEPNNTSYLMTSNSFIVNENIVEKLSEALLSGNRTNEILAETQKDQSQTIKNLMKFITEKLK